METKTETLFYEIINILPKEKLLGLYKTELFDINNNVVGYIQFTYSYNLEDQIPISATISTSKGCINYNYIRVNHLEIVNNATYSAGYHNVLVQREYISETKRKITITYTD